MYTKAKARLPLKRNPLERVLFRVCVGCGPSTAFSGLRSLCVLSDLSSLTGAFVVVGGVLVAAVEGEESLLERDVERADLLLPLLALFQVVDGATAGEAVAGLGLALALAVETFEVKRSH